MITIINIQLITLLARPRVDLENFSPIQFLNDKITVFLYIVKTFWCENQLSTETKRFGDTRIVLYYVLLAFIVYKIPMRIVFFMQTIFERSVKQRVF